MIRTLVLVSAWCATVGLCLSADEPKKPQWQRTLTGADAKAVNALDRKFAEAFSSEKYADAIMLKKEAIALRIKVQGADHWEVATERSQLEMLRKLETLGADGRAGWLKALEASARAQDLENKGQYRLALSLRQEWLEWSRKVLGEDHYETARSYNYVAANLNHLGKRDEAQSLLQKALAIRLKVLGEKHPHTAASYAGVAMNLKAQGRHAEAQSLYMKALDIYLDAFGEEHPTTAVTYHNVAVNLYTQGKYAEAQPLLQKALDIHRKVFGEGHLNTAQSYDGVASNLAALGRAVEAQPLYQKALDIKRRVLGEEHHSTATTYNNVAANLSDQGKHSEAQPLLQKALDINRKVLGEEHPDTATSYSNVAMNLNVRGKHAEAQLLSQKALDIFRKVLGEEHPSTAASYINLAFNLYAQRKQDEAEALLDRAIHSYESSRLTRATGLDRASLGNFNPRLLSAVLRHDREPAESWRAVEFTLARGLLDQQATGFDTVLTAEERAEQTKQRQRIATIQPEILILATKIKRTAGETAKLEKLLVERHDAETHLADLDVTASKRQVADPAAIRKALPADAALLFWVDVPDNSGDVEEHWVCAVRATGDPKWERLPGMGPDGKWSTSDKALPEKFRSALAGSASLAEVESLAKQLHAQRIAPVLKHLDGVKTLYIIGTDWMTGIPVDVLTRDYAISYVPSGTFLARLPKNPGGPRTLLAVGDPIYEIEKSKVVKLTALPPGGLLIQQLAPGGAAEKARLKPGDVILKYGDVTLKTIDDLRTAIQKAAGAKEVEVTYWRIDERNTAGERTATMPPGPLGVILDRDPAPEAIANRRKTDELFLALKRGDDLADLPGSRFEVTKIAGLFDQPKVFLDGQASEGSVEGLRKSGDLSKFRYLHFATHGKGNSVRAFDSKLILSQDQPKDEFAPPSGEPWMNNEISAREVLDHWKLNAELVTLSACETAIGKAGGGDGSLGFAQAFLNAGSRAVCLSLWEVDDTATALLMQRFYQNLLGKREGLKEPMSKMLALKEAKEWLRSLTTEEAMKASATLKNGVVRASRGEKKVTIVGEVPKPSKPGDKPYAHPQYWAAFVLIGDPN